MVYRHMSGTSGLHIVRMGEPHLRQVFSLIDHENWGWEFAEIQQIHGLDPGSSVVALDGTNVVGLVTCVDFGSQAFIVHVIVRKGWRGKGVGVRMVEAVLSELDSREVSSVELHANPEAVEFYSQFSFGRVEDISFYAKEPPHAVHGAGPDADGVSMLPPRDVSVMSEALSAATGYRRSDIEGGLSRLPPHHALARVQEDRATSLLLSRTGLDINGAGPWVMERPTAAGAEAMMRAMLLAVPAKRVDILVPGSSEAARAALASCGFSLVKPGIVRVVRPSRPGGAFPQSVLAVGHIGLI